MFLEVNRVFGSSKTQKYNLHQIIEGHAESISYSTIIWKMLKAKKTLLKDFYTIYSIVEKLNLDS